MAGLDVVLAVAHSSGDDRLLSRLLGANAGALFVLFAFTRRLRAARAGRKLEQHFLYSSAPCVRGSPAGHAHGACIKVLSGPPL